jgi:hypothetical protein
MTGAITFAEIDGLTGYSCGIFDVACPECGPARKSSANRKRKTLRIWRKEPEYATFDCERCGVKGWARSDGASVRAPHPHRIRPVPVLAEAQSEKDRVRSALAIWDEAVDPTRTVVETYLASRGLQAGEAAVPTIRFHPALRCEGAIVPAMVALFRDIATDAPCGIHRTFLDGEGRKIDRRMLGRTKDAAIKLDAEETVTEGIGIAKGIETSLAVIGMGWRPVWALGSANAIARFPVLAGLESLTIFADHDDVGIKAARTCGRRWADAGLDARVLRPPAAGADWNDMRAA